MTTHLLQLRKAAGAAISTAMTANGYTAAVMSNPRQNQALPYVRIITGPQTPRNNKTHDGTTSYLTFVVWAATEDAAVTLAAIVLAALTNRASPISVSGINLITSDYLSVDTVIREDTPATAYGVPIRMQYRTHE